MAALHNIIVTTLRVFTVLGCLSFDKGCHGLIFLAQTMEGNDTQPDTNGGGGEESKERTQNGR